MGKGGGSAKGGKIHSTYPVSREVNGQKVKGKDKSKRDVKEVECLFLLGFGGK